MVIDITWFKGFHPIAHIKKDDKDKFPVNLGIARAKKVIDNIEGLKKFVAEYGSERPEADLPQIRDSVLNFFAEFKKWMSLDEVYDAIGQKIKTLLSRKMAAGTHKVKLRAENLPSGVYLYRIVAGEYRQVRKMILIR